MVGNSEYEENILSLLTFALEKRGINKSGFFIGEEGQEKYQNDKLCLLKSRDKKWIVLYTERGSVFQEVRHSSIRGAVQDFFWKLNRQDTPWEYRAEWEAATGKKL